MSSDGDHDRLKKLTRRVDELEGQIRRFRELFCRTVGAVALIGFVFGFVLPLLVADEGYENLYLLPAITELAAAGDGPRQGEALFASIVVAVFTVLIVATGIAVVCTFSREVSDRTRTVIRVLAVSLLLGCGCIWLLVLALTGIGDGRVSGFSPAAASVTIGAVLALLVPRLLPE